jgi:hypothetical protein
MERVHASFSTGSGLEQPETLLDEGTQGLVGFRPAQETEDAEQKDVGQTIALRLLPAGIGHARQHLYEWVIHGCNLSLAASWQGMVTPQTRFPVCRSYAGFKSDFYSWR